MNYGYIDINNYLVRYDTAGHNLSLVDVQVIIPEVTSKVDNIPLGLEIYYTENDLPEEEVILSYHEHTSGDGTAISHWTQREDLRPLKRSRIQGIDLHTKELISLGFLHAATVFSASANAQRTWSGLMIAASSGIVTFPIGVSTLNDLEYTIGSIQELGLFYAMGVATLKFHYDGGRAYKLAIDAAVDEAAIDAVIDTRELNIPDFTPPAPSPSPSASAS